MFGFGLNFKKHRCLAKGAFSDGWSVDCWGKGLVLDLASRFKPPGLAALLARVTLARQDGRIWPPPRNSGGNFWGPSCSFIICMCRAGQGGEVARRRHGIFPSHWALAPSRPGMKYPVQGNPSLRSRWAHLPKSLSKEKLSPPPPTFIGRCRAPRSG